MLAFVDEHDRQGSLKTGTPAASPWFPDDHPAELADTSDREPSDALRWRIEDGFGPNPYRQTASTSFGWLPDQPTSPPPLAPADETATRPATTPARTRRRLSSAPIVAGLALLVLCGAAFAALTVGLSGSSSNVPSVTTPPAVTVRQTARVPARYRAAVHAALRHRRHVVRRPHHAAARHRASAGSAPAPASSAPAAPVPAPVALVTAAAPAPSPAPAASAPAPPSSSSASSVSVVQQPSLPAQSAPSQPISSGGSSKR
jgi:hypothetical protein